MSGTWGRYDAWNSAIADAVFSPEMQGRPAYLDLEDEMLSMLWERSGRHSATPAEDLAEAVRATLHLEDDGFPLFAAIQIRLDRWSASGRKDPPPVLALLAVLSLAAEAMATGEGMAAHNYYGRLFQLLGIDDEAAQRRVTNAYRAMADQLWSALNSWLDLQEGLRGTPTAYPVGPHHYVGLPLSQALVRKDDRRRFQDLFLTAGLGPSESVGIGEMCRLLDEWIQDDQSAAGSTLRRLWDTGGQDLKERVASVAALELQAWAGPDAATDLGEIREGHVASKSRLVAWLELFLRTRFRLGIDVRGVGSCEAVNVSRSSQSLSVPGRQLEGGWLRLVAASLDDHLLSVPLLFSGPEGEVIHHPRAMYVLVRDETSTLYFERDRVVLGVDCMLLTVRRLAEDLRAALTEIARPGWISRTAETVPGLPNDWALFSGVQVMTAPDPAQLERYSKELFGLLPVSLSQMAIAGGLVLPGLVRKWSSLNPPEIRVTSEDPSSMNLAVDCIRTTGGDPKPEAIRLQFEEPPAILRLDDKGLPDGDYEVVASAASGRFSVRRTLRLRSGDSPAPGSDAEQPIGHLVSDPLWPLRSCAFGDGVQPICRGAITTEWTQVDDLPSAGRPPKWKELRGATIQPGLAGSSEVLGAISRDSCLLTGAHIIELPPSGPYYPKHVTVQGVCHNCGLVKRYPSTWWRAARASQSSRRRKMFPRKGQQSSLSSLPPIATANGCLARAVLDGLFHLQSGSVAQIDALADQIQASPLFVHEYIRTLEALGHIEITRDPVSLAPNRWQVAPPALAEAASGKWQLIGSSPGRVRRCLELAMELLDGQLERETVGDCIDHVVLTNLDTTGANEAVAFVEAETGMHLEVVSQAGERLGSVLPPFSQVVEGLPVIRCSTARKIAKWHPGTARWMETNGTNQPGAYRFESFTTTYGFRSPSHVAEGTMAVADARTVRYAVASMESITLAEYDEQANSIKVPLGADLPGLYARAAILASGQLAVRDQSEGTIVYAGVGRRLGRLLVRKLHS